MNQALAVMVDNDGLGAVQAGQQQPSKWASILTGIGTGLTTAISAYQQQRPGQYGYPTLPYNQPGQYGSPTLPYNQPGQYGQQQGLLTQGSPYGIGASIRFDPNQGLCIGNTCIPILYLGLGGLMLFFLYKEPPKRGR